jgi:protein phosphatase
MKLSNIYYLHEIGGKKNQEDYIWPPAGAATGSDRIFIVSDGVGGAENGELASRLISECMGAALQQIPAAHLNSEAINNLLKTAQHKLVDYARERSLNEDMATTFSLLVLNGSRAFISWCGDSRVYHIRNGKILYKTSDHSLVNTLVKSGEITEAEAAAHPQKNIILKAIRADYSPIEAEAIWVNNIEDGDYFLLCTDGLLENISDNDLESLIQKTNPEEEAMIYAFQQYCFNKTRDNYSMYLLQTGPGTAAGIPAKRKLLIGSLLVFFAILAAGGYYYYRNYIPASRNGNDLPPAHEEAIVPSASPATADTGSRSALPDYEIIEEPNKKDSSDKNKEQADITKNSKPKPENDTIVLNKKILP